MRISGDDDVAARYFSRRFDERVHSENERHAGDAIDALLNAGADPTARNAAGKTPWDVARANEALQRSDAYWRLNDARFEDPREDTSMRPGSGLWHLGSRGWQQTDRPC